MEAAHHGQVPMLRYLLNEASPSCPINDWTTFYVATEGWLEALQFLRQEVNSPTKCKWNRTDCLYEDTDKGRSDVVEWINNQPAAEDDNTSYEDIHHQ
jgi:hypothetical protein